MAIGLRTAFIGSFVTIALAAAASPSVLGASFDCDLARKADEVRICASPELSRLDETMAALYLDMRAAYANDDELRSRLTSSQRDWLKARATCVDDACLKASFEARIDHLTVAKQSLSESATLSPRDVADAQAEAESDYQEEQAAIAGTSDDPQSSAAAEDTAQTAAESLAPAPVAHTAPTTNAPDDPVAKEPAADPPTHVQGFPAWVRFAAGLSGAAIAALLVVLIMRRRHSTTTDELRIATAPIVEVAATAPVSIASGSGPAPLAQDVRADVARSSAAEGHHEAAKARQLLWTGIGLAVLLAVAAFPGWQWLQKPSKGDSGSAAEQATAANVEEAAAPTLELPKRLSCTKEAKAISRWEDGTMIYDLGSRPAMMAVPGNNKIFAGTFSQTSKTGGTFTVQGILNTSTNQLTQASEVAHLEVVAVNSNGVYTLKNDVGTQYCLADVSGSANAPTIEYPTATSGDSDDTGDIPSVGNDMSLGDKAAIGYVEELRWVHQGTCETLYRIARRMVGSGLPYDIQIRQVDSVVNKAIDAGCIAQ